MRKIPRKLTLHSWRRNRARTPSIEHTSYKDEFVQKIEYEVESRVKYYKEEAAQSDKA